MIGADMNLRDFCKKYDGRLAAILPPKGLSLILSALEDEKIHHGQAKKILTRWFQLIGSIGIDNYGNPYAKFNDEGMRILIEASHVR